MTPADLERVARQVRELDDERVLVPTGGTDTAPSSGADPDDDRHPEPESPPRRDGGDVAVSADAPGGLTGASLEAETAYAVDVTVRTDRGLAAESFRSNDVRVVFEDLLRWYAGRVEPERDPETVVGLLLAASDIDVTTR
ncbi:MAG: hypothetical protein V5A62_07880 [Haloarculaceae archaeon]